MPRALIIESDAALAKRLSHLLSSQGVQSQVTPDGTEGVNLARSFAPDVIVLCVELSRVSGYSICNKLKKDPELGRIPLILTSSQATEETFEQHKKLKTRAEAYLKKPFSDAEILGLLRPYIEGDAAASADEVEVGLDEVSVDLDEAILGETAEKVETLASEPSPLEAAVVAPVPKPAGGRPATGAAVPNTRPTTGSISLGGLNEGQLAELRAENKQLRQKVQKLEETMEQKELEFNDRLLEESSRGREGLEAKKKLLQLERDLAKSREASEKSKAELDEARRELDDLRLAAKSGDSEKQVLATKIGQLVDKVKSLASERDALQKEVERLTEAHAGAREESEGAAKVREKARKAVEIAVQLIADTGLLQ
jgi:CheY-like chemotaxis protein